MTDETQQPSDAAQATATEQEEQYLPQSQVDKLMARAKNKGKEKGQQEMQEELQKLQEENERLKNAQQQAGQQAGSMGGMQEPVDTEQIKKQVYNDLMNDLEQKQTEQQQEQMEQEAKRLANEYHTRMQNGNNQFSDFDDVMKDFDPGAFPNLVYLATQVDNTPGVMYELVKNPTKLASMSHLAEKSPQQAMQAMKRINDSIQANQQAQQQEQAASEPVSRLQSNPMKGQDTGSPNSVQDFKKLYRG